LIVFVGEEGNAPRKDLALDEEKKATTPTPGGKESTGENAVERKGGKPTPSSKPRKKPFKYKKRKKK